MKVVAFIPIKLKNIRLPGKNIKKFDDGTPLIYFVQKTLIELKNQRVIDEVYVYCSDESICEFILDGVQFLKRPSYLDGQGIIGPKIYKEFVNAVDSDIYVLAHATSPFVKVSTVKKCIQEVVSDGYDSSFCGKKIQNFLWQNKKPINFDLSRPLLTQDLIPVYCESSTPYVFTKECFSQHGSRTGINPYICECNDIEAVDIDYPEDFEFANMLYMNYLKGK